MTARSVSDLAADVRVGLNFGPLPLSERGRGILDTSADSLAELVARLEAAEAQAADAEQRHVEQMAPVIEVASEMEQRAKAAEAQVAALTQEHATLAGAVLAGKRIAESAERRAEAAEAALAEMEQRWLGMRDCYDREVIRGGKAERALADTRRALAAYRSALRSGEQESAQLREMGDRALAAADGGQEQQTVKGELVVDADGNVISSTVHGQEQQP